MSTIVMHAGALIRVELINGDARQGRYISHNATHLYLNDGLKREIQLVMIRDVMPPRLEQCVESS
jgi:hypothetical protein